MKKTAMPTPAGFFRRSQGTLRRITGLTLFGAACSGLAVAAEPNPRLPPPPDRAWVNRLFDSWRAPTPPRRLIGNIHYVGAAGVSSFLITTPEGHFLLDTGFDDTVSIIQLSVEKLGFKVRDVKFILSSHAHIDHVGGHARMKQLSGARILASPADARTIESGGADDFIQWPKDTILYAPAKVDRTVTDGERVTLGGVTLTAHLTPGHTRGATTWTMEVTDGDTARAVVFFSSASINAGTRLIDNPQYPGFVGDFETTFAKLRALPCDVFFAPHGGQFAMAAKFARNAETPKESPFVDPTGWKNLLDGAEKAFRDQLAIERAGR